MPGWANEIVLSELLGRFAAKIGDRKRGSMRVDLTVCLTKSSKASDSITLNWG